MTQGQTIGPCPTDQPEMSPSGASLEDWLQDTWARSQILLITTFKYEEKTEGRGEAGAHPGSMRCPAKYLLAGTAHGKGRLTALPAAAQTSRQPAPCAQPAYTSPSLHHLAHFPVSIDSSKVTCVIRFPIPFSRQRSLLVQ